MNTNKLWSYETLVRACSGAVGSVTAMSAFFPLDTIRSRLQVEDHREAKSTLAVLKELIDQEGVESLYRGLEPVLISVCCSNFVYFYSFHGLRTVVTSESAGKNAVRDLVVAAIAGAINVCATTPLWVANSRIKMQGAKLSEEDKKQLGTRPKYNGLMDALVKIYGKEGCAALWSSLVPSLILVINPTIQFAVYETIKARLIMLAGRKDLSAMTYFCLGAVSKTISTVLTYPLQLAQTKLRYGSASLKKMNLLQIFAHILRTSGYPGLYKGLEAKILQTVTTAALMFLCYEKIVAFVFRIMKAKSHSM